MLESILIQDNAFARAEIQTKGDDFVIEAWSIHFSQNILQKIQMQIKNPRIFPYC